VSGTFRITQRPQLQTNGKRNSRTTRAQAGIPWTIGLPRVQVNIVTEAGERDLVIARDVKTKLAET